MPTTDAGTLASQPPGSRSLSDSLVAEVKAGVLLARGEGANSRAMLLTTLTRLREDVDHSSGAPDALETSSTLSAVSGVYSAGDALDGAPPSVGGGASRTSFLPLVPIWEPNLKVRKTHRLACVKRTKDGYKLRLDKY